VPASCGNAAVYPGDIVLGDAHGVMVIPRYLAGEIAIEGGPMEVFEDFVLQEVLDGHPIIGLYPPTDADTLTRFEAWTAR
jgi:regulator of RNase E activity RraA